MCTAATYKTKGFYFGRTLDYEFSYGEEITITPRNYPIPFRHMGTLTSHYAIIGMAHVADNYPLYYDGMQNVAQFEFIPWILSRCATIPEVREALARMNLVGTPFSPQMPAASLHWIIADKNEAIVVESMTDGLHVHDDPAGVLTNNPPFDLQMFHLNNYLGLSPRQPENHFSPELPLATYSRGMGALGLPGDLSSQSRFARVAFTRANSISGDSEEESVSQFFHILGSVDQQRGCCEVAEGKYEITIYTSCCSAETGTYYYTTYENHQITAVDMKKEALDSDALIRYPMILKGEIRRQN